MAMVAVSDRREHTAPELLATKTAPGAGGPFAWRPIVAQASAIWLASRVALAVLTYFAATFPTSGPHLSHGVYTTGFAPVPPHAMLAAWLRWDGIRYVTIAQQGYANYESTAFFPLYPLLIHALTLPFGGQHALAAAMLIGNLGTLGACIGVGLLAAWEAPAAVEGAKRAVGAIRVMLAYPLAFFLAAPYTEGIFLTLATFSLLNARRGKWGWAALCAFLAALTRPTGAALIPALFWEFGRQAGWWRGALWRLSALRSGSWREPFRTLRDLRSLGALALLIGSVPAGVALYAAYLGLRFGHPLVFLHAQTLYWHHQNTPLYQSIPDAFIRLAQTPMWSYWQARQLLDLAPLALFTVVAIVAARRLPIAYTLYTFSVLYLAVASPLATNAPLTLISAGRYVIAAAPLYLALGRWTRERPWLDMLLIGGGFLLQGLLIVYFLMGHWLV